jgi:hypothetical protein
MMEATSESAWGNPHIVPSDTTFGTPGGPARPAFTFNRTDYWAQGLNVGFNFRF